MTHKYFVVDDERKKDTYVDFYKRFGSEIKTIHAKIERYIDEREDYGSYYTPWITPLLILSRKYLEKLTLELVPVENLFRHVNKNITHLILRGCYGRPRCGLLEFCSLKKFEVIGRWPPIRFNELTKLVHNNRSSLESLVLGDFFRHPYFGRINVTEVATHFPLNQLMQLVGANLTHLKEFGYVPRSKFFLAREIQTDRPPDHIIDQFVNSLKHLESLSLSTNVDIFMDFTELLRRLSTECMSIKYLKLYDLDGNDSITFDLIRAFKNIEILTVAFVDFGDEVTSRTVQEVEQPYLDTNQQLQWNEKSDSIFCPGKQFTSSRDDQCDLNDVKIYCGQMTERTGIHLSDRYALYNEYMVRNENQVQIEYLLKLELLSDDSES